MDWMSAERHASIQASSSVSAEDVLTIHVFDPVTLILDDADFAKLMAGKANAQNLFMKGKLKIKGDVMKATKMEPILTKAQGKAKL
jgi:putative sterol carrier protein